MKKIYFLIISLMLTINISCYQPDNPVNISDKVPKEAVEYYQKGLELEQANDIENAKKQYEIAVSIYSFFHEANMKLYEIYKKEGDLEHAEEHYNNAQKGN